MFLKERAIFTTRMATDCDHAKVTITTDGEGNDSERVCPICDDVEVETLD